MARITIAALGAGDEARWDAFVNQAPGATFFHLSGWKSIIEKTFAHPTYYLMAQRGGEVSGVLPLTLVRTKIFGASLISNAFCVYGGPVARDGESLRALEAAAIGLMQQLRVPVLEFRAASESRSDWPKRDDLYVTFGKAIDPSPEKNLKAIPRTQRAMVRKGMQNGLTAERDNGIDRFYSVYAESVRNLGTPVFPKRLFELIRQAFPETSDIITVVDGGTTVASVMNFYFRDTVLPYFGGGASAARRLAANDYMYWEVMRQACERGYRQFDFGRSKRDTGSYAFKCNWGFEPIPLTYQFQLAPGRKIPELNPLNPKLRLFVALWKRLPLTVATRLGPAIVRSLG
jgi:FemAB-related protein (PEP-CTERM system-associated)